MLCLSAPCLSLAMSHSIALLLMCSPLPFLTVLFLLPLFFPSRNHFCNLVFIFRHFQFPVVTKQAEVTDQRVSCRHTRYTRLPCFAKCIRGEKNHTYGEWHFSFGRPLALYEFLNFELLGNLPEIGTPGAFCEDC